ncbi:uncharacterized protein LOC134723009 [Mytilus trossulus]|uniref:uncharacterized protein LOC134723009 n=1 Tax=Mytilus trossulus TaxID=6551 RepID=UPI003007851E
MSFQEKVKRPYKDKLLLTILVIQMKFMSVVKHYIDNEDICYVEWTLGTPAKWDIDEIKETLEIFSSLMGKFFRIVFVYKGSLVIQTSAQLRFLQSDVEFQLAVKSFLKDLLDICNLDTDTKTIVQVTISVSNEKFESKYFDSQTMDTSWLTCDLCSRKNDSSNAIQFCSECQYKLCRQCLSNHNSNAAFFEHHLTNISTLSFENFCVKHDGSILDFFCVVNDCLCCLSCKTEEHNSCQDVLPLEDAAKDVKHSVMFQELSDSVLNFTMTLNRAIASQDINIVNLDNDESTISIELASYTAKIKNRLDELKRMATLETRSLRNEHIARTEFDRNSLLLIERLIKHISRKIDQESKKDSQKQMFVLLHSFKLEILGLESKLQNILPTLMTRRMIFQPQESIENTLTTLGVTKVKTFQCVEDYKPHKPQQVQVPSFTHQKPSKFRFERKIEIKRSDDSIIRKMCITDDNRLLLCTFNGNNLLLYSDSRDYLQECQLSSAAWDIVVIPGEDKVVVTLPVQRSIQIIDIKSFSADSIHPVPFACWAITIVNGKICVGGQKIVYILDQQGKQLKKVRLPNDCHITNLHSGPMESIYYTDRTCDAVCHFTLEGEERFRYTSVDLKGSSY